MFWLGGTSLNREEREKNVEFQYLSVGTVRHKESLSGNKISPDSFAMPVPAL